MGKCAVIIKSRGPNWEDGTSFSRHWSCPSWSKSKEPTEVAEVVQLLQEYRGVENKEREQEESGSTRRHGTARHEERVAGRAGAGALRQSPYLP